MKTKCPTCSSPVTIEGRTTMYYVPEYERLVKAHDEMVDLNKSFQDVCKKSEIEMKAQMDLIEKMAGALEWAESDIAVLTTDLHGKYNAKHQSLIRVKEALQEYQQWKDGE